MTDEQATALLLLAAGRAGPAAVAAPRPGAAPCRPRGTRRWAAARAVRTTDPRRAARSDDARADRRRVRRRPSRPAAGPRAYRGARRAHPPRRCCGSCGRAPGGAGGCAGRPRPAVASPGRRTAISTRSVPCSTWRHAPRSSGRGAASSTSWRRLRRSRSRPTRCRSAVCGAMRCGCSPHTAPRASSGGSSSSRPCRTVVWPDLRRRGSLLQAERLSADGLSDYVTPAALLAEERRLFYVACTRARERLVVTAVRSPERGG